MPKSFFIFILLSCLKILDENTKGGNLKTRIIYVGTDNANYYIYPDGEVHRFDNLINSNPNSQNESQTSIPNQNNMYDVPADNSCLFWSVATAYLLPVRNNDEEFKSRFIQLFGEDNLEHSLHFQELLQQYDLEDNRSLEQSLYQDVTANRLVRVVFRNRVVNYIERNLDNPTQNNANGNQTESFRSAIHLSENQVASYYLNRMRNINMWGGEIEILAMNNLLNSNIIVNNNSFYQSVNQNSNNNNIMIYYVELEKGSDVHNHYNFLLPEHTIAPIISNTNSQISTITKMINKYNALPKEKKQQRLNEINQHYQNLSEDGKKAFEDKLKTIGGSFSGGVVSAIGAGIFLKGSSTSTGASAAALAPETLGLSLVIGGLAIAGASILWWINSDHTTVTKQESHNQYNEIEKYYKFLAHDQLKLDIDINKWNKIKQIYQENSNSYQEFKNKVKSEITNFKREDHSGWGGSITADDIDALIKILYNHFREIDNHFSSNSSHGWKIVTNTIGSYFIIEEE